jgi:hypothetical protein
MNLKMCEVAQLDEDSSRCYRLVDPQESRSGGNGPEEVVGPGRVSSRKGDLSNNSRTP